MLASIAAEMTTAISVSSSFQMPCWKWSGIAAGVIMVSLCCFFRQTLESSMVNQQTTARTIKVIIIPITVRKMEIIIFSGTEI